MRVLADDGIRALLLGGVRLIAGAQAHWQGCAPERRQRIYFANHASHLDTVVIVAALPPALRPETHPVAALDYWGASGLRRYLALTCLNAVLIDRSHHGAADPLTPLAELLERGQSLILFPEGTRGSGTPGPFRSGLFHLAQRFPEVELVPVYLENLYRILPKGSLLLVPLICSVRFGTPIRLAEGEAKAGFLERARGAVLALAAGRPAASPATAAGSA
jgi:1-acyl-sn-glycerol-3-phosphate acyltransferase